MKFRNSWFMHPHFISFYEILYFQCCFNMFFVLQEIREKSANFSIAESKKIANRDLNRYRDVNPFDHSRIVLRRGTCSYINASLVKVFVCLTLCFRIIIKLLFPKGTSCRKDIHIDTRAFSSHCLSFLGNGMGAKL